MTRRCRPAILGLWLSAAICSLAMTIAHAEPPPNWMVAPKSELPAEVSVKAESTLTLLTKIGGIKTEFTCPSAFLDNGLLEAEGKGSGSALFSGCKTFLNGGVASVCEPTNAGTEKGVIAGKALKAQLVSHEGATLARVQAVIGETFGIVEMGKECAIGSKVPIIGTLYLKDAGGEFEVEKATHMLQEGPLIELWAISKTAEHKSTVSGSIGASLSGEHLGRLWSGLGGP